MKPRSKSEWMTPAGFGCGVADVNRPSAHFFFTGCEIRPQAEQMIGATDQRAHAAFIDAEFFRKSLLRHQDKSIRSLSICALMTTASQARCVFTYSADIEDVRILVGIGQIGFLHIARENRRFVRKQKKTFGSTLFLPA